MVLRANDNKRLTEVGAGTPMGELLRRYWHPIAPAATLDNNPVRKVKLLGEELVLFRDRSGQLGLIEPRCAHRLVHLQYGIPEEHGLRCPYHGWCYDATGQCTDTPLESPNSQLKDRVQLTSYPVQALGGLVFAYLGPMPAPVLPPWDFLVWPNSIRQIAVTTIPCNWLQCHENSTDPYHNTFLHGAFFRYQLERMGELGTRAADRTTHRAFTSMAAVSGHDGVVFERDQYGLRKGIKYLVANGAKEARIQWFPYNIFPYYSRGGGGLRTFVNMRVPMDDTHTYHLTYCLYHAPGIDVPEQCSVPCFEAPLFDEVGRPILDYVSGQDMAAWYSQGEITDRTKEVLGATDLAIIEYRRMLAEQISLVESGADPLNVFRDPSETGDCITLDPSIGAANLAGFAEYRNLFHKGYAMDDVDRYGPATPLAADLMQRAEIAALEGQAVSAE